MKIIQIVGQGQVTSVRGKVESISDIPVPNGRRLMRFLGMAVYYRNFLITEPLTNLLGKRAKYVLTNGFQKSLTS